MQPPFLKTNPDNCTPQTRTPWAGQAISRLKRQFMPHLFWPEAIGESWEVSTDPQFPSQATLPDGTKTPLRELLSQAGPHLLGPRLAPRFGSDCPLLLKWIEANSLLSVQVHPRHGHRALGPHECGKPEAWLVLSAMPGSRLFLGFRDGVQEADVRGLALDSTFPSLLHPIEPRALDFIFIPAGCVHALGPGILVAEPQLQLPGKSGKTFRLHDWNRLFDSSGRESPTGAPRELHRNEALEAIDWSLPTGKSLEKRLMARSSVNAPDTRVESSPFRLQVLSEPGCFPLISEPACGPRLLTLWGGTARLADRQSDATLEISGGESAIIAAGATQVDVHLSEFRGTAPAAALFALDPEADPWHF